MKDEIKEILDKLNNMIIFDENLIGWQIDGNGTTISKNDFKTLLDYITNLQENARGQVNDYFKDKYADEVLKNAKLQEENERLEKRNIYYINNEKKLLSDWHQEHNEAIEYKSRNEKAIECIKDNLTREWGEYLYGYEDLLNILNGGDEEC